MAFTLPAAQYLMNQNASNNKGSFDTAFTLNQKTAGNLPITSVACEVTNVSGARGVYFGLTSQAATASPFNATAGKLLISSFQFNSPNRIQVDTKANRGVTLRTLSGATYREYSIGGNDTALASSINGPNTLCLDLNSTGSDAAGGTFAPNSVDAWGFGTTQNNLIGNSDSITFFQRVFIFDTAKTGVNLPFFTGAGANFSDALAVVQGTDYSNKIGAWLTKSGSSFFMPIPFSFGDGANAITFDDGGASVVSPADNAANTVTLSGNYSWGTPAAFDFNVSNLSTATLSGVFSGMGAFTMGSSVTATGVFNLAAGFSVISRGAALDGATINGDLQMTGPAKRAYTNLKVTGAIKFSTEGEYTFTNCTINEVVNIGAGALTLINVNSTITTNSGPSITINSPRAASITNLVAGSRVQLFNVTTNAQIVNEIVAGTEYSATYNEGTGYSSGDQIRVRITQVNGNTSASKSFEVTTVATNIGFSVLAAQESDTVYMALGVNGALITSFGAISPGAGSVNLTLSVNADFSAADLYAFWAYTLTTEVGIRDYFGGLTAKDIVNFEFNNAILDVKLDTTATISVRQTDNRRIYRTDQTYPVKTPTTSGYGMDIVWRNTILIAETTTSGLTAAESAKLTAIDGNSKIIPALL